MEYGCFEREKINIIIYTPTLYRKAILFLYRVGIWIYKKALKYEKMV